MWYEERNGKYRYFERFTDYMTEQVHKVSVTLDSNNPRAMKLAAKMLDEKIAEISRAPGTYTLKQAADLYIKDGSKHWRASTTKRNGSIINGIIQLLGPATKIEKLTAGFIYSMYVDSGKSADSCNESIKHFKTFIKWCYRHDIISSTACIDKLESFKATPHRQKIEDKYLNSAELALFLDKAPDGGNKIIAEFLALSGLRIGELVALENADVTPDVIKITKTYSPTVKELTPGKTYASNREVPIQPELQRCIKRLRSFTRLQKIAAGEGNSPLFIISPNGGYYQYYTFNRWFKRWTLRIIGRELTAHSLRHTHASLLAQAGYPLESIARRLGHESSTITKKIYLHATLDIKKHDAELIKGINLLPPICPHREENFA